MDFSTIKFFNTSENELYLRHICLNYFLIAIHSISTLAFLGNLATSKQLLAGNGSLKYLAYSSFTFAKSFMSDKSTVVLTISSYVKPRL